MWHNQRCRLRPPPPPPHAISPVRILSRVPSLQEAFRKFDVLTNKHIEQLRKFTKQIQDARLERDNAAIKTSLKLYDEALER